MVKCIRTLVLSAACAALLVPSALAAGPEYITGFGTLKRIDIKGQRMEVTSYNWDTNDVEDVYYIFDIRKIQVFNIENVRELKAGDDLEFEWIAQGNRKYIAKLAKGSMPMEEVELLWDPESLPDDVDPSLANELMPEVTLEPGDPADAESAPDAQAESPTDMGNDEQTDGAAETAPDSEPVPPAADDEIEDAPQEAVEVDTEAPDAPAADPAQ